jgi:hypothetical protein
MEDESPIRPLLTETNRRFVLQFRSRIVSAAVADRRLSSLAMDFA